MTQTKPVSPIENFIQSSNSNAQTLMRYLRKTIFDIDPRLDEAIKWGRLTFTRHCNWREWLCALEPCGQGVRLLFHHGASLDDPQGLLQGSDRHIRYIEILHADQIEQLALPRLLHRAINP